MKNKQDIVIIGGGLSGVLTAYFLKDSNYNITLIDQSKIGYGATYKSTAKVSYLQRDLYQKIYQNYDLVKTKLYLDSQIEGIHILLDLCSKHKIDCELTKVKSYLFASSSKGVKKLKKERDILEKLNISCTSEDLPIPFPCKESFYVDNTYTFNSIKFINSILKIIQNKINIRENTIALEIKKEKNNYIVITDKGEFVTKKVIITNHYPFFLFPSFIPLKNHVEREYVNAVFMKSEKNFCAINMENPVKSIRWNHNYLFYVSNNHKIMDQIDYNKNYENSKKEFKKYFHKKTQYTWINQDLFTTDSLPLIGFANHKNKDILIATGYNGWGMSNSFIASKILSDLILEKSNLYVDLFKVDRMNLPMIKNSGIDSLFYLKAYIKSFFYKKCVYTKIINGLKYNVYKDKDGVEHIVKRKCPHMKCNLIFNFSELTWDCPCHGSRFDIDGNVVEGPASHNIKYK